MTDLLYATPSVTNFGGYLTWLNTITSGMFWTLIVITIFIVIFVALSGFSFKKAILGSSFITFILAGLLKMMSLVSDALVGILIIILALGALMAYWDQKE